MPTGSTPPEAEQGRRSPLSLLLMALLALVAVANGLRHGVLDGGSGWSIGVFWLAMAAGFTAVLILEARRPTKPL